MTTSSADDVAVTVVDNRAANRYEAHVGDVLAGFALYEDSPEGVIIIHTEVSPAYEGHGVGGHLAGAVLDDLRARGLRVIPRCPFIAKYIRLHPQYADMVARDPSKPRRRL